MTTSRDTWLRRSLRRFLLGSGPLKRGSDRVQMIGRLVVVLSFLAAAPVAVTATTATATRLEALAAVQAAAWHRTEAVLLENAPASSSPTSSAYSDRLLATVPARATWSGPGGTVHEGVLLVRPRTPAGTTIPVWVDADGHRTPAPLDRATIPNSASAMGALALIGMPLVTWTLYGILCWALDAHRERRWARGWAAVEPTWGTRLL